MQIVFMGTPDFAVGALEALITQGYEITAVVTQPDKPKGRSKELQFPPVKECAVKHGIPVFQPRRIKTPEAIEELKKYPADIYIVAAVRTDPVSGDSGSAEIRMSEHPCSLLPGIPRGISYPESDHRRRGRDWCDHHADECGTGHRRYVVPEENPHYFGGHLRNFA